ncbi:MAG: hypothetical protein R2867_11150 [Caldilineaceae bacterium]
MTLTGDPSVEISLNWPLITTGAGAAPAPQVNADRFSVVGLH